MILARGHFWRGGGQFSLACGMLYDWEFADTWRP